MGQLQRVSWRTVGYSALGTVLAAASVVGIINSDGVRPTSLTSSAATRWLYDQPMGRAVLVDGLAGRVVAKVDAEPPGSHDVAVQGIGGAFLVAQTQGSVRTISTAKLQLGTAQPVASLLDPDVKFGVGASGLTVVSSKSGTANVVAVNDVTARTVSVPVSNDALVAADGSMWMISGIQATHVNVDESKTLVQMRSAPNQTTTVGAHGIAYDNFRGTLRWIGGHDVVLQQLIPNASEAALQQPGDDARCVWIGVDDTLACVGPTKIDHTLTIAGMHLSGPAGDRLAVAGDTAVIVRQDNTVARIDLEKQQMANDADAPTVPSRAAPLNITAAGNLVWVDDQAGNNAWVVNRFGINTIDKDDAAAPLLDAQGQVKGSGDGGTGQATGNGNTAGDDNKDHNDHNGQEDPPHAVDDSVTSRAGVTVTIPVTGNDWDPDGTPFAVSAVGSASGRAAASGSTDILSGDSVSYVPNPDFSGKDSFNYTIIDPAGQTATATVRVELFPPGSPNQPPLARADTAFTRVGQPITIDVLANDIDPERDTLAVAPFHLGTAKISDATGPTNLPALRYVPPELPGHYTFTYRAVDPQGGTSEKAVVSVTVTAKDAENSPPTAAPDSIRLRVGVESPLNVKANDTDSDGDDLLISLPDKQPSGVSVRVQGQQLLITLLPSAPDLVVAHYILHDSDPTHQVPGSVLVLRIADTAPNRPPVASPDADRVVIGNSVKIPVTANDVDPEGDTILLLSATDPVDGSGTTTVENNSVRFKPTLPDIKEPTPVTFTYKISDGHGNDAIGRVTVTVLLEALPGAPSARDDFADTETDKPVTIDVLANDNDPSGGGRPHLTTDPVCASGDTATRTPDDRVIFTPPPGKTGTFKCKYSVSNNQGFRAEASIIVSVTAAKPGNRPPSLLIDVASQQQATLGKTLVLNANNLANDPDGDPLVFSAVGKPNHGTTNYSGQSSVITYQAPAASLADETPSADTFEVTISDGKDGNVHGAVLIKLNGDTPPTTTPVPPKTHDVSIAATTGVNLPYDIVKELKEANTGDTLTLLSASAEPSSLGTAQAVNGFINIVPTAAGVLTVSYSVQNAAGVSASGTIKVTITDPPQTSPPVAVDDSLTVSSGGVGSVNLVINDTGISDPGDNAVATLDNRPPASFGTVDISNNVVRFVAAAGAEGTAPLTYTLKDGSGSQSTGRLTITVQPCAESLPQAIDASVFTPYQTPIDLDLSTYILAGSLQPGSVRGAGMTGLTGTYTPPAGMNGTELVSFVVENGCQQKDTGHLTIDVNHSPLGGNINRSMSGGDSLTLAVGDLASDDEALTITSLSATQPWATFTPTTVSFSPPPGTPNGPYTFTATVQDPGGLTASATINVTINNTAPTAVADVYGTTDSLITFDPTANDFDSEAGQLCVQAISVTPPTRGTQIIEPIPKPSCYTSITVSLAHGISTLSYTIRDSGGLTSDSTITITSNNPPTIANATKATGGQPTVDISLDITDLDSDSLRVGCNTPTDFIVVVNASGGQPPLDPTHPSFELNITVSPTFNDDPNNSAQFTCTVRDDFSAATATMTVTVN